MISTTEYIARADGSIRLVLTVEGPFPDDVATVLDGVGGTVTDLGDQGATVTWDWASPMAPDDPEATCTRHVERAITVWAAKWAPGNAIDLR